MEQTVKIPEVFFPEESIGQLDQLLVSKVWVCKLNHSGYPYYLLEDQKNRQVGGLAPTL